MKKLFSVLLVMVICLGMFASCGGGGSSMKVGIVQIADHPSLDEIRDSFIEEMKTLGVDANIEYKSAQGDPSNLNTICQNFVSKNVDVIVAIATPSALTAVSAVEGTDIPVLFSAVSDPVEAGLATDFDHPIDNVTGTSDVIPVEQILEMAIEVNPDAKSVGMLFNPGEPNSISATSTATEFLKSKGIEVLESGVSSVGDLQTATESLIAKNPDFIFAPNDNTVATGMQLVGDICKKGGVPIYVGADTMVKDGGFATIGVNYTFLGQQTAEMCKMILEGTKASDLPIRAMEDYVTLVNKPTAEAVGVDINLDVFTGAEIIE